MMATPRPPSEPTSPGTGISSGLRKLQRVVRVQKAISHLRELPSLRRLKESQTRRERALKRAPTNVAERFQRSSAKAVCAHLLEEGAEELLEECTDVPIKFKAASPGEDLYFADLLLTSLPTCLLANKENAEVKWVQSLPEKVREDLHYASFQLQKLVTDRTYMVAISDAFQRILGVHNIESPVWPWDDSSNARVEPQEYPAIVKPAAKVHGMKYLVFDDRGLETARSRLPTGGAVVDKYVPRSGAVYHIFVVNLNIFVAARPTLPHVLPDITNAELRELAEKVGGTFVDDEAQGRFLEFDSGVVGAKLASGDAANAAPLADWPSLAHVGDKLNQVANTLEQALGVGMFGFTIMLDTSNKYAFHMVDLTLVPGPAFHGTDVMLAVVANHLFEECQQRAVRVDIRASVKDPRQVIGLVQAQHPGWLGVRAEDVAIDVLSASTQGDKTGLVVSLSAPGKEKIVCRLRGVVERTAFEQAIADEMMDAHDANTPLMGYYYGTRVLIGYTEALIKGVQLEKALDKVNRPRLCRNMGRALRDLHRRQIDVPSPDYFDLPLCVSRLQANGIIAWEAVNHVPALRQFFDEVFAAVLTYDVERLPPEAKKLVFGHFDVNLTNVLVDLSVPPELAPKVTFIDWEQAGPNIAAYDFGKFLVSYAIAKSPTEAELGEMVRELAEGYAPEWSTEAKARLQAGMYAMMPYVAALNFLSNVRHASTEIGDRWVKRGTQHYRMFAKYRHKWTDITEAQGSGSRQRRQDAWWRRLCPACICGGD